MNLHSVIVWEIMQKNTLEKTWDKEYANDMFILWYLHDIGKQFWYTSDHAEKWGEILRRSNYKYWQEVYYHWCVDLKYKSSELDLLNSADLQVLQDWTQVSVTQRLEDIKKRYWENSLEYKNSKELAKILNLL
jgi:hypothetical protein